MFSHIQFYHTSVVPSVLLSLSHQYVSGCI